jgi:hypothetical protein
LQPLPCCGHWRSGKRKLLSGGLYNNNQPLATMATAESSGGGNCGAGSSGAGAPAGAPPGTLRWAIDASKWNPTEEEWKLAAACVQEEEKTRIGRFHFKEDAKMSMLGRLLIRKVPNTPHLPFAPTDLSMAPACAWAYAWACDEGSLCVPGKHAPCARMRVCACARSKWEEIFGAANVGAENLLQRLQRNLVSTGSHRRTGGAVRYGEAGQVCKQEALLS